MFAVNAHSDIAKKGKIPTWKLAIYDVDFTFVIAHCEQTLDVKKTTSKRSNVCDTCKMLVKYNCFFQLYMYNIVIDLKYNSE